MDQNGGSNYILMGTQQMMSVPYALYAETAGSIAGSGNSSGPQFMSPTEILNFPWNLAFNAPYFDTTSVDFDALLGFHANTIILYYEHNGDSGMDYDAVEAEMEAESDGITFEICDHLDDGYGTNDYVYGGNSGQLMIPVGTNGSVEFRTKLHRSDLKLVIVGYYQ